MKKLLPILLIGVMLFSLGIVAFVSPKISLICGVTVLSHYYEYVESGNWYVFVWRDCEEVTD